MRQYILDWISNYRHMNRDLFYDKIGKNDKPDKYGIIEGQRGRWPRDFDFSQLPDDVLIAEYTQWLIKSFRQR